MPKKTSVKKKKKKPTAKKERKSIKPHIYNWTNFPTTVSVKKECKQVLKERAQAIGISRRCNLVRRGKNGKTYSLKLWVQCGQIVFDMLWGTKNVGGTEEESRRPVFGTSMKEN